jgi:hypothetical protein
MIEKFDKRIVERSIRKGEITQKTYENYLKNLPDSSNKCFLEEISPDSEKKKETVKSSGKTKSSKNK